MISQGGNLFYKSVQYEYNGGRILQFVTIMGGLAVTRGLRLLNHDLDLHTQQGNTHTQFKSIQDYTILPSILS